MKKLPPLLGLTVVAAIVAGVAVAIVAAAGGAAPSRPANLPTEPAAAQAIPVLYELPEFRFVDQDEKPMGLADLRGKLWVADFMFTRCNGVCPMQSANMQALQEALRGTPLWDEVRLVSISLDASHDTPSTLREYAERYKADPAKWSFLHGPKEDVWKLSAEGFKLHVEDAPENEAMPIEHVGRFVVVDRQGRVRAYHSGTDPAERAALIADLQRLASE